MFFYYLSTNNYYLLILFFCVLTESSHYILFFYYISTNNCCLLILIAPSRIRTGGRRIKSPMLYHLSYWRIISIFFYFKWTRREFSHYIYIFFTTFYYQWTQLDSNQQPRAYKARALDQLSYESFLFTRQSGYLSFLCFFYTSFTANGPGRNSLTTFIFMFFYFFLLLYTTSGPTRG